jgi:hypothetical protein
MILFAEEKPNSLDVTGELVNVLKAVSSNGTEGIHPM